MKTTARREGEEWVLNGAKMWITNGTVDGNGTGDAYLVGTPSSADFRLGLCPHWQDQQRRVAVLGGEGHARLLPRPKNRGQRIRTGDSGPKP